MIANLPDLVRSTYPTRTECHWCHVAIELHDGLWLDRAGSGWCMSGLLIHEPEVTR